MSRLLLLLCWLGITLDCKRSEDKHRVFELHAALMIALEMIKMFLYLQVPRETKHSLTRPMYLYGFRAWQLGQFQILYMFTMRVTLHGKSDPAQCFPNSEGNQYDLIQNDIFWHFKQDRRCNAEKHTATLDP